MDASAVPKKEKGLRKLWFKVRASMKSDTPTTTATSTPETIAPKAVVAPAPAPVPEMKSKPTETKPTMTAKDEAARRFERAQAIFKKYDMELDLADWDMQPKSNVERVQKQPRMRVRYTCHECKTSFGRDTTCRGCAHERCKDCIRYPPKKNKKPVTKDAEAPATMPTSGPCHECRTQFPIGASECSNCQHKICDQCLKETVVDSPATAPQPIPAAA